MSLIKETMENWGFGVWPGRHNMQQWYIATINKTSLSHSHQGCIKLSIPPPGGGGNKIKGFGDGEENQKLEKKKKENF